MPVGANLRLAPFVPLSLSSFRSYFAACLELADDHAPKPPDYPWHVIPAVIL
jgi:hypothetical protein